MREGKGTYYFDKDNNFSGHWKNNVPLGDGVKSGEKHKHHRKHSHDSRSHKSKNKIKHIESENNTNENKDSEDNSREKKLEDIDGIPGVVTKKKI